MKTKILILLCVFTLGTSINSYAQKLKKFDGLTEKKIGPKTVKVPYTDVVSYLGYADVDTEDEVKKVSMIVVKCLSNQVEAVTIHY